MKKYEYKIINKRPLGEFKTADLENWNKEFTDKLNQLGLEGWKAVNIDREAYSHPDFVIMVLLIRDIS